jgi:hypothetical protein
MESPLSGPAQSHTSSRAVARPHNDKVDRKSAQHTFIGQSFADPLRITLIILAYSKSAGTCTPGSSAR